MLNIFVRKEKSPKVFNNQRDLVLFLKNELMFFNKMEYSMLCIIYFKDGFNLKERRGINVDAAIIIEIIVICTPTV